MPISSRQSLAVVSIVAVVGLIFYSSCQPKSSGGNSHGDQKDSGQENTDDVDGGAADTGSGTGTGSGSDDGGSGSGDPDKGDTSRLLRQSLDTSKYTHLVLRRRPGASLALTESSAPELYGLQPDGTAEAIAIVGDEEHPKAPESTTDEGVQSVPEDPSQTPAETIVDTPKAALFLSRAYAPPQSPNDKGELVFCRVIILNKADKSLTCWPWVMAEESFNVSKSGEFIAFRAQVELPPPADGSIPPPLKLGVYLIDLRDGTKMHTIAEGEASTVKHFAVNDLGDVVLTQSGTDGTKLSVIKLNGERTELGDGSSVTCMVTGHLFPNDVFAVEATAGSDSRLIRISSAGSTYQVLRQFPDPVDAPTEAAITDFSCREGLNQSAGSMYFVGRNAAADPIAVRWGENDPLNPVVLPIAGVSLNGKELENRPMFAAAVDGFFLSAPSAGTGKRVVQSFVLDKGTTPPSLSQSDLLDTQDLNVTSLTTSNGKLQVQARRISDKVFLSFEFDANLSQTTTECPLSGVSAMIPIVH